ncbi:MAG: type IV secretion system DNA-binding domain-containing protein, partial [Planctomycetes bacterium]|nr:type IV secretion system DNA-binding domain-containing protein [Planctomycetota bacterium]
ILTNSAGKVIFRVGDPDTAELAAKMMGESDVVMSGRSVSHSQEGASVSADRKLERWTKLSSDLFITGLRRGEIVYMGLTDGLGAASIRFVRVR